MNVFKFKSTSMVRAYLQYRLSIPLIKTTWQKQNVNYSLVVINALHIQHQCYHTTSAFFKKRQTRPQLKAKMTLTEKLLNDTTVTLPKKKSVPIVEVWNGMKVKQLAIAVNRDIDDVLDALYFINKKEVYDEDHILTTTNLIASTVRRLGYKGKMISRPSENQEVEKKFEDIVRRPPADESQLLRRHPVVTIMGHVDHGKTTLLDALRNTSVVESEFGGITQHIGAFDVILKSGERVTFLDTPGHAAFKAMRYRGAHVTDIIVLVVAADDGVKDQTLQSIKIAKDANVPVIVAINKIDKPNIEIKKTLTELAEHGIITEDLGGDVQCIKVSALKGMNLENLTEAIVLQAELMDLKADFSGLVEGVVIECRNDIGRGKLVTALIQRGTLRKGRYIVSGLASAKVRAMFNDSGSPVLDAKPADAVQIIGWKALPNVGDEILEVENDRIVNEVLKIREKTLANKLAVEHKTAAAKQNETHIAEYKRILGLKRIVGRDITVKKAIYKKMVEIEKERRAAYNIQFPTVNVIIKGDVAGSVEALLDIFDTYTCNSICHLNVIHYGVGAIAESDIDVAEPFKAIVYGFNVNTTKQMQEIARIKGIILRNFNVIYKLIDDIKQEIDSILPIIDIEKMLGEAVVLQQFDIKDGKKKVNVAGCRCVKGVLLKSEMYRVVRNGENIYTGKLVSMRHLKDEVPSIEINLECGLRLEDPSISFQPGDTLVCFKIVKDKQRINWDPGF